MSGGVLVVSFDRSPTADASVGVLDEGAGSPGLGVLSFLDTTTFPSACTGFPLSGSARSQYVPGSGSRRFAT